jgi:hypothetical protein
MQIRLHALMRIGKPVQRRPYRRDKSLAQFAEVGWKPTPFSPQDLCRLRSGFNRAGERAGHGTAGINPLLSLQKSVGNRLPFSPQDLCRLRSGFNRAGDRRARTAGINPLLSLQKSVGNRLLFSPQDLCRLSSGFNRAGIAGYRRDKSLAQFAEVGWKPTRFQSAGLMQIEKRFQPRRTGYRRDKSLAQFAEVGWKPTRFQSAGLMQRFQPRQANLVTCVD